jgi:hypothetical protein
MLQVKRHMCLYVIFKNRAIPEKSRTAKLNFEFFLYHISGISNKCVWAVKSR